MSWLRTYLQNDWQLAMGDWQYDVSCPLIDYRVFDLNVQVESTTGNTGITGKSKTKPPRDPRDPRGLLFLNTQVKNALVRRPLKTVMKRTPQEKKRLSYA